MNDLIMDRDVAVLPCEYQMHPTGVHEFILHEASPAAVDGMYTHLHRLYQSGVPDGVLMTLCTVEKGSLPMAYTMQRTRAFYADFPVRPLSRAAIVGRKDSAIWGLTDTALKLLSQKEAVRFFTTNQRTEAFRWLLA